MKTLNIKDLAIALNEFRSIEGRKWKSKLRDAWATGNWGSHKHYVPLLQSFRNRGGIDVLNSIHWALAQEEIEKLLNKNSGMECDVITDVNKTFYKGYSFEIVEEPKRKSNRWSYTVRHASGNICDGGYSSTKNGAERKARRLIRLFNSY